MFLTIWELEASRYDKNNVRGCTNIFHYRPAHSEDFIFLTIFGPPPQVGQGPRGPEPIWARAQVGRGPRGPGPIWARAQVGRGPSGPRAQVGPGPKWARAQVGPGPRTQAPPFSTLVFPLIPGLVLSPDQTSRCDSAVILIIRALRIF